tara:strand:- start:240 stop:416 length:177 start_codon:yes stop_codon:yes gene_type:complete
VTKIRASTKGKSSISPKIEYIAKKYEGLLFNTPPQNGVFAPEKIGLINENGEKPFKNT